jgi:tripartite-type tricarboxylate transporter receptor subunit TctC
MVVSASTLAALLRTAQAIDYPTRPIRWIIGFPPGGGADVVARIMGGWLSERLGQQIIIENRPGAGTNIATQTVINSPPDGYTLLWAGISNVINATVYETLPFDFFKDIAPVAGLVVFPLVFEVNPSVPAKTIPELIAYAKANPGKITLASFGTRHDLSGSGRAIQDARRDHNDSRTLSRWSTNGRRPYWWPSSGGARRFGRLASTHSIRSGARAGRDHCHSLGRTP